MAKVISACFAFIVFQKTHGGISLFFFLPQETILWYFSCSVPSCKGIAHLPRTTFVHSSRIFHLRLELHQNIPNPQFITRNKQTNVENASFKLHTRERYLQQCVNQIPHILPLRHTLPLHSSRKTSIQLTAIPFKPCFLLPLIELFPCFTLLEMAVDYQSSRTVLIMSDKKTVYHLSS